MTSDPQKLMVAPTLTEIAAVFVRYGSLTFGGGGPTIAALEQQTVERRGWLNVARFRLAFALSRFTPGTNLLAFCTAIGWQIRGLSGALTALVSASLPCSIVCVVFTLLYDTWRHDRWVSLGVAGASASAIGIVAASCWHLIRPHRGVRALVLAGGALGLQFLDVPPVRILLMAAVAGLLWRTDSR